MRRSLALAVVLLAAPALAQVDPSDVGSAPAPPPPPPPKPPADDDEEAALVALRNLEARLSAGETLSAAETASLTASLASKHVSVRALAAAVLAWLDPATAAPVLLGDGAPRGVADAEPRVRTVATQSLLAIARRLPDDVRRDVVGAALLLLDDPADEAACAGAELALALAPSAVTDAVRVRAAIASDVRYACFARIGGLPIRPIEAPVLPREPTPPDEGTPAPTTPAPPAPDGTWVTVAALSSAGLLIGALVPTILVPGRDVLLYDDDRTVITREELSVVTQAAGGLAGAAVLGGGAWALFGALAAGGAPLSVDEAGVIALGTGALGLVGAGVPMMLSLRGGLPAGLTAAGLALGAASSLGLVAAAELDKSDEALALGLAGLGAMAGGLAVFTAVPVGLERVGDADRTMFGFATAAVTAGALGMGGLALGPLVDVAPGRTFAGVAGGLVGGGLFTGAAFLLLPPMDVKSRIACGIGLGGEVLGGTMAFLLVPDAWVAAGE
ncbi:MAG: hypothetical protein HYS27_09440 [Deltaproteobacteria bacterium]|nr:hypothetical protein [Deltaproteobacteria bacterium]